MWLLLLPVVSALLLFFSFFFYHFSWLVLIAYLPLLFYLRKIATKTAWYRWYWLSIWLSGLFFIALNLSWLLKINPLIWVSGNLKIISWIVSSLAYSTSFLLFGIVAAKPLRRFLTSRRNRIKNASTVFATWILAEFGRAIIVSIVMWGHGGNIGANWNFNSLGFAVAGTALGPLARFVGLYGLCALSLVSALVLYEALHRRWKPLVITAASLVILVLLAMVLYYPDGKLIKAGVVQTQNTENSYQAQLLSLLQNQTKSTDLPIDILAMPPGINLDATNNATVSKTDILNQAFQKTDGLLISSDILKFDDRSLKTQYQNGQGIIVDSYNKPLLSPYGEYMSLLLKASYSLTNNKQQATAYGLGHQFKAGTKSIKPFEHDGVRYGTSSGLPASVSPFAYESLARQHADIFINSMDLNQFASTQYTNQIKQAVRFQALANAKPLVQASIGDGSYVIDSNGRIIASTTLPQLAFLSSNIKTSGKTTVSAWLGEWTVWLASIYLLFITIQVLLGSRLQKA